MGASGNVMIGEVEGEGIRMVNDGHDEVVAVAGAGAGSEA